MVASTAFPAAPRRSPRHVGPRMWAPVVSGAALYAGICAATAAVMARSPRSPLALAREDVCAEGEDVEFKSRDGNITLSGWLLRSAAPTGRCAILVHGWMQNRLDINAGAADVARVLLGEGHNVLLFDLRGCGLSGGRGYTLGRRECQDVLGAYDFMLRRGYAPSKMTLMGWSMGAVSIMEALDGLEAVDKIVLDSPFSELESVLIAGIRARVGFATPLLRHGLLLACRFFGLNPKLCPVESVARHPERALLLFHGDKDVDIPVLHAQRLRGASTNPLSRLEIFEGADHVQGYRTAPAKYVSALLEFINGSTSNEPIQPILLATS